MEEDLARNEWQCIYCGRFIDDPKAVHRVRDQPWNIHACVVCNALVEKVSRSNTVPGRQRWIRKVVPAIVGNAENSVGPIKQRLYVGRDGVARWKVQRKYRGNEEWSKDDDD